MKKITNAISVLIISTFLCPSMSMAQSLDNGQVPMSKDFTSSLQGNNYQARYKQSPESNFVSLPVIRQDTTLIYQIMTIDGNEFIGTIVEQDAQKIVMKTENLGVITIQKIDIRAINLIEPEKIKDGAYWQDYLQSTRLFWMPNGYGLKKGEAYYQNVWVFFNQFSVGITDNILIGGGLIPLFLFAGTPTPMWITPKVSFPIVKEKVNVGIGGLFATVLGEENTNFGIVYGSATFGPRDKNLTVGVGYGYADGDWATRPTLSLGFIARVGRKGYFITENYLISTGTESLFIGMIGGRSILGNGGVGLDYGLVIPIYSNQDTFWAVPWLGLTVPLGKRKNAISK